MKAVRSKITAIITAVALLVGSVTATSVINKTSALQWDFEKAGFKNSWEYLLDRDGFVYGCDYNYVGMVNFDEHSLGPNFISNKSATYNHYMAYIDIYNIKALGFNAINYWLLTDMQGIHFDENGYCVKLDDRFKTNLRDLLELCRELGMYLVPSIQPHGIPECAAEPRSVSWEKYTSYLWNDTAMEMYFDNVIDPIADIIAEYQDVVICCGLTVENSTTYVNDPERGDMQGDCFGTTWEHYSEWLNAFHDRIKAKMPNMLTSTEEGGGTEKEYRLNDTKVDLIGNNIYHSGGSTGNIAEHYKGRPGYIGEYNIGEDSDGTDFSTPYWGRIKQKFIVTAKEGGWLGAFYFKYGGAYDGGKNFVMFTGNTTDYETMHIWAPEFRYVINDGINEYRGLTDVPDTPVLLANKGSNEVFWIPGRNIEKFKLERSDDGGATWKTVADDLGINEYSIDNGLIKYTDTTVPTGIPYCYRVTGYDANGKSSVGTANNAAELFIPQNLVKNSSFEDGTENWTFEVGKITDEQAATGNKSAKIDTINGNDASNYGAFYQVVDVEPNKNYRIRYKIKFDSYTYNGEGDNSFIRCSRLNSENKWQNLTVQYSGQNLVGEGWVERTFTIVTDSEDSKVRLQACTGNKNSMTAYYDDFSITELR